MLLLVSTVLISLLFLLKHYILVRCKINSNTIKSAPLCTLINTKLYAKLNKTKTRVAIVIMNVIIIIIRVYGNGSVIYRESFPNKETWMLLN